MARTIQHLTPAARRFYRAFYQWNVVQDAAAGALPHSATTACSRRIATSSHRGQEKRPDREHSKWKLNPNARTASGGAVEWRPMHNQPNPDQDEIRSIRTWLDFPVRTPSQWPSAGLQAWQQAVRYRGEDGLVVEVALPLDRLERMKQAYGPSLERLTKGTGATIELRPVQDEGISLALVKTPLVHADRLKIILWTFRLDQPYNSVASMLNGERIKRNRGPAPKGWNEYERSMWNRFELKALADWPPSQMLPWEMVFRARDVHTKRGSLDLAIPESWFQYMRHERRDATVFLRSVFGDVHIPKFPIKSARDGSEVHDVRHVSLRGDMAALHAATSYLGTFKKFEDSQPITTAHGYAESPLTINKDPTSQTGISLLVPSALTTFVTDKAFRLAVKRLTGLEKFHHKIHPVDDDHVSISFRGLREPCRLAAQLVRWRIRFAYLHLFRFGAPGHSGAIAPPPDRFIPAHEAQPQPQFYAKLIFVPDLHPKLTEDLARQWIQDDDMLKLSLETGCKIATVDKGRDGWIVEGPEPGLERVKAVFQQRLDQAGEDLRVWEIERGEVQWHRADTKTPTWSPSMANLECLQMHERSSGYLQHLAQCSDIVSYHPAPQPNAPLLNEEFTEDDASSSPESTPTQRQTLPEDMRAILRPLTHPVVLITARDAAHSTADQSSFIGCRGVTVSSFTAVTLFPQPIVSFNLKVPSRTWDAIASSQWLTAHILSANADAATLTHAFTQPYPSPEHAFHVIRKLGVQISLPTTEPSRSPRLNHKEAVLAQVHARILPAKCVQAGDHVIVVAEVKKIGIARREDERRPIEGGREKALARLGSEEVVGLTYAKKGYRKGAGEMIQIPDKLPDVDEIPELESTTGGEVIGKKEIQGMEGEESGGKTATHLSEEDDEDVFKSEEMHGREGSINGRREDVSGDGKSEAMQEEDKQDLGMGASDPRASNTHHKDAKPGESTAAQSSADEVFHSLRESDSQSQELSGNVDQLLGSARAEPRPVLGQPRQLPAFSSAERKMRSAQFKLERSAQRQPNRSFSAAATPPYEDEQGNNTTSLTPRQPKQDQAQQDPSTYVDDPTLFNKTVADLLGEPPSSSDSAQHPAGIRRIRGLLRAQEASLEASHELQSALEAGTLTPAQSLELETTIRTNDRRVTKTLALRAANALRILLDSNSLPSPLTGEAAAADFRRVAWMEAQIEKGQRALLEEAKEVRELFEQGKIDEEVFLQAKEKLGRVFGVLDGEVGRLREWVREAQEEGDGGDGGWD
ncbi:hypothetical protein KC360_g7443 [Hortaea werneckii]|nr:hypothetical protein KC359_g7721 [Hortaea werneckii]KAI7169477.1 hypothetical protein KC360_g7443 [Hortaea werneckii]